MSTQKSGFVTLVGRSNVGKSTLLNAMVGNKLAAVSPKPQTTRHIIHGVVNTGSGQAVLVDTPGVFKEKSGPLAGTLAHRVHEALQGIDLIVYVVDPCKALGSEERYCLSLIRKVEVPKILALNKSDLPAKEKIFLDDYLALGEEFAAVFQLSALHHRHVQPLVEKIFELLPEGEPLYPPDQITNIDSKFWVAEVIREKIFMALRKEVPYTTTVEVTDVEDKEGITIIKANVLTTDRKYKSMIIGAGGRAIKEIGIAARKELETALNRKVFLELEVEVDKHWEDRV